MAAKGLTESWRTAEAAKPSDWTIRGVVFGPREVDPAVHGARWAAWAVGPGRGKVIAEDDGPQDALFTLSLRLRELG